MHTNYGNALSNISILLPCSIGTMLFGEGGCGDVMFWIGRDPACARDVLSALWQQGSWLLLTCWERPCGAKNLPQPWHGIWVAGIMSKGQKNGNRQLRWSKRWGRGKQGDKSCHTISFCIVSFRYKKGRTYCLRLHPPPVISSSNCFSLINPYNSFLCPFFILIFKFWQCIILTTLAPMLWMNTCKDILHCQAIQNIAKYRAQQWKQGHHRTSTK